MAIKSTSPIEALLLCCKFWWMAHKLNYQKCMENLSLSLSFFLFLVVHLVCFGKYQFISFLMIIMSMRNRWHIKNQLSVIDRHKRLHDPICGAARWSIHDNVSLWYTVWILLCSDKFIANHGAFLATIHFRLTVYIWQSAKAKLDYHIIMLIIDCLEWREKLNRSMVFSFMCGIFHRSFDNSDTHRNDQSTNFERQQILRYQ